MYFGLNGVCFETYMLTFSVGLSQNMYYFGRPNWDKKFRALFI